MSRQAIDLSGKTFGRLRVLHQMKDGRWRCRCSCGRKASIKGANLRSGSTKSCGCIRQEWRNGVRVDLAGKRYGRLSVIKVASIGRSRGTTWLCKCECGKKIIVPGVDLRQGDTKSCGCLKSEVSRKMMRELNLTHGDTQQRDENGKQIIPPEWTAWHQMRYRCFNPKSRAWKHYGGRGIKVCKRWDKYENFLADMGRRPSPDHSLDRMLCCFIVAQRQLLGL